MRIVVKLCWIGTAIAAVVGILILIVGAAEANSASQEASAAGIGIGIAAIPYVFTRALSELLNRNP